ncbi:hypothetical protein ACFLTA_08600 [Bacteroidota bacterium]
MGTRITYLLGAGASANCIPVIKNFKTEVARFKEQFSSFIDGNQDYKRDRPTLKPELNQFSTLIKGNPTVDILAKKFYLKKQLNELWVLKKWLTIFFHYRQYFIDPDERYDQFLAAIVQEKGESIELPSEVNIITWNYDLQFEICMSEYLASSNYSLSNIQSVLNVHPRVETSIDDPFDISEFNIIRLNNTAGIYVDSEKYKSNFEISKSRFYNRTSGDMTEIDIQFFKKLIEEFDIIDKHKEHTFTYCWEKDLTAFKGYDNAKRSVNNTRVLVIIGYSFPFVNRIFDNAIINSMHHLQEVIIQDNNESEAFYSSIESRFHGLGKKPSFTIINDVGEFYLPSQL